MATPADREARIKEQKGRPVYYCVSFTENRTIINIRWQRKVYTFDNLGEIRSWFRKKGYRLEENRVEFRFFGEDPDSRQMSYPTFLVYKIDIGPRVPASVVPGGAS